MPDNRIDYQNSRSYVIPPAPYNAVVVPGPCLLDALLVTAAGTTDYAWTLYDGLTAAGTVLAFGNLVPVTINTMRLPVHTGLFFTSNGTGVLASWVILVKLVPPPGF